MPTPYKGQRKLAHPCDHTGKLPYSFRYLTIFIDMKIFFAIPFVSIAKNVWTKPGRCGMIAS